LVERKHVTCGVLRIGRKINGVKKSQKLGTSAAKLNELVPARK
jgi:hypothetical protein